MSGVRWLEPEEQRAWRAFLTATRAVFEQLDRQLQRDSGMPLTYYDTLVQLSEASDRMLRMSELADRVRASPSRLSHAVARLEEKGWVRRVDCPTDRRGQYAVLTDEGFEALAAAAPGHVEAVRTLLFDALTPSEVEQVRSISEAVLARAGAEDELSSAADGRTSD